MTVEKGQLLGVFSTRERDRRWQRAQEFLRDRELDALLVIGSRHNEPVDRYLSNWIPGNTVIFPSEGDPTLLVAMAPQLFALRRDTPQETRPWIRDVRAGARGAIISETLKEKGLEKSCIGVVGIGGLRTDWEGWVPFKTWERVVSRLPTCNFVDVTDAFAELMMVKSNEELMLIRKGARILEEASIEMARVVARGVSEQDVYDAFLKVLHQNRVYAPSHIMRSGPETVSWGQAPWLFNVGIPRILQPGDIVLAEIFAPLGGVEAQIQVAVAIPPVSSIVTECARLARKAYEEGLRLLQPGRKFTEVVAAMEAVLDRPDVWHLTPLIHSMNPMLCIGPTGMRIECMPGIEAYRQVGTGRIRGGEVVLQPGMVFELEPNACIGLDRVNIGGTAIVKEDGPEVLNKFPTQMRVAERV